MSTGLPHRSLRKTIESNWSFPYGSWLLHRKINQRQKLNIVKNSEILLGHLYFPKCLKLFFTSPSASHCWLAPQTPLINPLSGNYICYLGSVTSLFALFGESTRSTKENKNKAGGISEFLSHYERNRNIQCPHRFQILCHTIDRVSDRSRNDPRCQLPSKLTW